MAVRTIDKSAAITEAVRAALRTGVAAAAAFVEGRAKEMCPVDTGTLRRSIHTEMQPTTNPDHAAARVGPDAPYGIYVEYGTRRMRAQPFLRPAFDYTVKDQQEIIREFVTEAILSTAGSPRLRRG